MITCCVLATNDRRGGRWQGQDDARQVIATCGYFGHSTSLPWSSDQVFYRGRPVPTRILPAMSPTPTGQLSELAGNCFPGVWRPLRTAANITESCCLTIVCGRLTRVDSRRRRSALSALHDRSAGDSAPVGGGRLETGRARPALVCCKGGAGCGMGWGCRCGRDHRACSVEDHTRIERS